jgi:hypothetical protein
MVTNAQVRSVPDDGDGSVDTSHAVEG